MVSLNTPDLWRDALPRPTRDGHKYDRGHTVILGSQTYTGATRLAAEACSRIGSGVVTVLSTDQTTLYRTTLPADIIVADRTLGALHRPSVLLAGPGGVSADQAALIGQAANEIGLVLDADAIRLWPDLRSRSAILTPHTGEFERFFPGIIGDHPERARAGAEASGQVLVLKGAETGIAAPDGRFVLNRTASPYLAKAGTGDVLAGLIAGLAAQGMEPFGAACAGVWIHGRASERIGAGLIPQDIQAEVASIVQDLLA